MDLSLMWEHLSSDLILLNIVYLINQTRPY